MTGNRKLFSSYKAYNEGNIIFGSNLRGNIISKGTISNYSLKIDNVEHVDNLRFNLLSVEQICDNKCRVTFSEHDSEITKDGKVIDIILGGYDLDEEEAIKVIEKKNLENDIKDETLEINEIVSIKESRNNPLENIRNIEGKTIGKDGKPMCAIRKPVRVISSCDENPNVSGDSSLKDKTSQSVNVTKEAGETSLNDFELRNEVSVEGAAVAIPYEANGKRIAQFESKEGMDKVLENGPWLIQTVPLILNVWSLNTDLKKAEVKKTSVWIKLHHLPIVTYSEGKSTYARALIEVSAENELFGIFDKCPKLPKEVPAAKVEMRALLSKKRNHQEKKSYTQGRSTINPDITSIGVRNVSLNILEVWKFLLAKLFLNLLEDLIYATEFKIQDDGEYTFKGI
ncbi:retrovirus-related pol polyprotein from transposon TNT 1-94 [Tanacetum coccineum]